MREAETRSRRGGTKERKEEAEEEEAEEEAEADERNKRRGFQEMRPSRVNGLIHRDSFIARAQAAGPVAFEVNVGRARASLLSFYDFPFFN